MKSTPCSASAPKIDECSTMASEPSTSSGPWAGAAACQRRRRQDLAGQDAELTAAGCAKVFREKASGAKTDRLLMRRLAWPDD